MAARRAIAALALLALAAAAVEEVGGVHVSAKPIVGSVRPGEQAIYEVVVENRFDGEMEVLLTAKGAYPTWVLPGMDQSFALAAGGRRRTLLHLLPPPGTRNFTYAFSVSLIAERYDAGRNLVARALDEDEFYVQVLPPPPPAPTPLVVERVEVTVRVVTPSPTPSPTPPPVWVPSLRLGLAEPGPFKPGDAVGFDITVLDAVELDVGSLDIDLQIVDAAGTVLPPIIRREPILVQRDGGTLRSSHSVRLGDDIGPGEYSLTVSVVAGGRVIGPGSLGFEVGETRGVEVFPVVERELLRLRASFTLLNRGNVPVVYTVEDRVPWYLDVFTAPEPKPTRKVPERDAYLYVWEVPLGPLEQAVVRYEVSYVPFLAATLAVLLAAVFMFQTSRALGLEKELVASDEPGEASVAIHLRNFSDRAFERVLVIDRIPLMARVKPTFPTLKPDSIEKGEQWTTVTWSVERLEPREERVFTYSMRSVLEVIGTMDLPPARLEHTRPDGRRLSLESEPVSWRGAEE